MNGHPRHRVKIIAAAAALCALHGAAQAQAAAAPAAAASAPQAARGTGQVITISAQKVLESPQKVPLSVTAISGETLSELGVKNMLDLPNVVTSVKIVDQGPGASVQVRGVGSNPGGANSDASALFAMDGVYQPRTSSAFGAMYDVERIELLKGPQGTLYGRNATVGALNVISRNPGAKFGGEVEVELGNYDMRRLSGALNVPVNEVLRLRMAMQSVKRTGYLSDGYNDADTVAGRIKALLTPTKGTSILITADTQESGGNGQGNIYLGYPTTIVGAPGPGGTLQSATQTHTPRRDDATNAWNLLPMTFVASDFAPGSTTPSYASGHALPPTDGLKTRNSGLAIELTQETALGTLTVLPAVRSNYTLNRPFTGGSYLRSGWNEMDQKQQSLEIRLASAPGPLRWIAGYFYFNEDAPSLLIARAQTGATSTFTDTPLLNNKAQAVFGQATWSVRPTTRLTGGLRYTEEQKKQDGRIVTVAGSTLTLEGATPTGTLDFRPTGSYSDNAVTYRLAVDHDFGANMMGYASLSTGYKAGGMNTMGNFGGRQAWEPEELSALAAGFKSRLLGGALQLNAELFLWKYKNQQIPTLDQRDTDTGLRNGGVNLVTINNPGTSTIYGFDLDAIARPTADDVLSVSLTYLHARNGEFVTPLTTACPFNTPSCVMGVSEDLSGKVMPFSPTWQANVSYTRYWDLAIGGTVSASLGLQGQTHSYVNYRLSSPELQPGFIKVNLNAGYTTAGGKTTVAAYLRNAGNEAVLTRGSVLGSGGASTAHYGNVDAPRTYGLTLTHRF